MFDPRLFAEYDRAGDTLYVWKRKPARLRSVHGDEPGIVWRLDSETGEPVGVIVQGYLHYWHSRVDQLAGLIALKMVMPEREAHDMLDGVYTYL